jgi:hypothetical protein
LARWLLAGLAVGAVVAACICWIALDHNPQGEFADPETGAFTRHLYALFAVWTATIGLPLGAILALIESLRRRRD